MVYAGSGYSHVKVMKSSCVSFQSISPWVVNQKDCIFLLVRAFQWTFRAESSVLPARAIDTWGLFYSNCFPDFHN